MNNSDRFTVHVDSIDNRRNIHAEVMEMQTGRLAGAAFVLLVSTSPALAQENGQGNWEGMSAEDWDRADSVVRDMAKDWGDTWKAEEGHEIVGRVVEDPDEPGIYYFATTREADGATQSSIFRYDSSDYTFERLWREDDAGDNTWRVVGHDGDSVVYAQTAANYDPGDCGEPLVNAADGADGAKLYAVPDTFEQSWEAQPSEYDADQRVIDDARNRQQQCEGDQPQGGGAQQPEQPQPEEGGDQQGEQPQEG